MIQAWRVFGLALTVGSLSLARAAEDPAADDPSALEGQWKVTSVELAGVAVPGLEGSLLKLESGQKTFTMPGGRVELGTYAVDLATEPHEFDSTKEGRPGKELGIVAVEGDVLKICLATGGGPRPREFVARSGTNHLLIHFHRDVGDNAGSNAAMPVAPAAPAEKPTGSRSFRMGFTGFVPAMDLASIAASHKFVRENGDILAHHIEGVPWAEALHDQPFPEALLKDWEGKKAATPPGGKVYLAISPGRGDLKVADKAGPLPAELAGKAYDDPLVRKAYLNYCRRAIDFFQPDYLAIGIEVNEIFRDGGAPTWNAYAALHRHVYEELKKERPELPIFASWTLHAMFQLRDPMLAAFKNLMPYNDLVAVSYYPFFVPDNDRLAALDWMTAEFDAFEKPYAFVETNDAAERLPLPQAGVVIEGTPQKQAAYYARLLSLAQERKFEFVISFIHQDYDALWEQIKAFSPELFIAWRDCGLIDEQGRARLAYQVWKDYLALPLE